MKERDFLMPAVHKNGQVYLRCPVTSAEMTKRLRTALMAGGMRRERAQKHSLYAARLYMPNRAYQANIARDRRRELGTWSKEETADVYTRDRQEVIRHIWDEVEDGGFHPAQKSAPREGSEPTGPLMPTNLDHADWEKQVSPSRKPQVCEKLPTGDKGRANRNRQEMQTSGNQKKEQAIYRFPNTTKILKGKANAAKVAQGSDPRKVERIPADEVRRR